MFLKHLGRIKGKINFRLAALYTIVFILSSFLLFGLIYLFLSSALKKEDYNSIRLKLLELWASYEVEGIESLRRQVSLEKLLGDRRFSMVRVADRYNSTLFLVVPEPWTSVTVSRLRQIYTGPAGTIVKISAGGVSYYIETASLRLPDGNLLQVGMNVGDRVSALKRFREIFAFVMIPFALMSFLGGTYLAARSLRPLRSLTSAVRTIIETGKVESRIPPSGTGDELDELVRLFNRMLEKIERLVEGMRDALDSVAHDLRTPMTRLRGSAESALQSPEDKEQLKNALVESMEEADAVLSMLNALMDISEAETGAMRLDRKKVNLTRIIEDIAGLYQYIAEQKAITLSVDAPPDVSVSVDVTKIRQVLANLLENAVKYTPERGEVVIGISSDTTTATIFVKDTGEGIPKGEMERVWERHYRGLHGRSSPGLGLGLSFVKAIVEAHNGSVGVKSKQGEGTEFSFTLPM